MSEQKLDQWLAAARSDIAQRRPGDLIEQRVLDRLRERRALQSVAALRNLERESPRFVWKSWFRLPMALAACLLITIAIVVLASDEAAQPAAATPFFALVASEAVEAERSPVLVSSQISRAALADYGLPFDPARADQTIPAELLMSRAGIVLAVRFAE